MKVTIIIPCFGHARLLPRAIESALCQTYSPVEIIVVDDGSPDDTSEVALRYSQRGVKLVRQTNAGLSAARNAGVAKASGDWLVFLDADDSLEPRFAERMIARANEQLADVVVCQWRRLEEKDGRATHLMDVPECGCQVAAQLRFQNVAAVNSHLVRRSALPTPAFDRVLRSHEDWDLWARLVRAGARFAVLREPLANVHIQCGSMSSHSDVMAVTALEVLRRQLAATPRTHPERRSLQELFEHRNAHFWRQRRESGCGWVVKPLGDPIQRRLIAKWLFRGLLHRLHSQG